MRLKKTNIQFILTFLILAMSQYCLAQCTANFTFDDSSLVVEFVDESQFISNDTIIEYEWDFGDGTDSNNASPLHIYNMPGGYTVSLIINTQTGCSDTISKEIYICDFNLEYDLQIECDADNKVNLDLFVSDTYGTAGTFDVLVDGDKLNQSPLMTDGETLTLSTELLADGQEHTIVIQSIEHMTCSLVEIITVSACVPPCNISNLKATLTNTDSFVAEVNEDGYDPSVLNVITGDVIRFVWQTDDRSVTSEPNNNGQSWDSGILDTGDEFTLYSFGPGIYTYSSSNTPASVFEGSLVSTCPDSAYYDLQLTWKNESQIGSYQLWIDGVPADIPDMLYSANGFDTLNLIMPGDGVLHTYDIIDVASPSCNLNTEMQAPLCGIESYCNLDIQAVQSAPCDQDSTVEVTFTVLSAGGSASGFDLYVDDEILESNIPYEDTETILTRSLIGDGKEHTVQIIDTTKDTCIATTTIILEDCSQPCMILNPFAGIGSNNSLVVSVLNDTFLPKDITISAGDRIIWQWQTDTLRSVTAFDFLFDSGVKGSGATFTSPILPVGVHRYYSEFNDMVGSITVQPNCTNGLIPIVYTFNKFGGANTGYNVFVDNIQINNAPIPYAPNGSNSGNSFVPGNGETYTVTIVDAVDESCSTSQFFEVPFCDESICDLFFDDPIISDCSSNNTIEIEVDLLSFNTTATEFILEFDETIKDTVTFDTSGINTIADIFPGDGAEHSIIVSDALESTCNDTLIFTSPLCTAPCEFAPLSTSYITESEGDTCLDGSLQLLISTSAVVDFDNEYIIDITSNSDTIVESFEYPLDGKISHLYTLLADGSEVSISIINGEDETCLTDTTFTLYACEQDPCQIDLKNLLFDNCRDGGLFDMTIDIDTFRVSDSLNVTLDQMQLFNGTYANFLDDPTFEITHSGEERELVFQDLADTSCVLISSFLGNFCPLTCRISADYILVDSCITAQDTSYNILVTGSIINALSDSIDIELINTNTSERYSINELEQGIELSISTEVDNPTISIFDSVESDCRLFQSIIPPSCILECELTITDIIVSDDCINGERELTLTLDYERPAADSLMIIINGQIISQLPYPINNIISTNIIVNEDVESLIIRDAQDQNCTDTFNISIPACGFSCINFNADFDFSIDSTSQTIDFMDLTTGNPNVWNWNFGDATVSSDANPFHTYTEAGTYTICLEVENTIENCKKEICKEITLTDINCNASYIANTDGLSITFINTSTSESEIISNLWVINGVTEFQDVNEGTFDVDSSGLVEICLTIQTDTDCTDTYCEMIEIYDPCTIIPSFDFEINFDTIQLSNTSTGNFDLLSWSMGDGNELLGNNTLHIYAEEGNYQICMMISNSDAQDCTFTICEDVEINSCDASALFELDINQDTLNAQLISPLGNNSVSWTFGNGFSANIDPVEYVYTVEGQYTVCATVVNANNVNCQDVQCEEIAIILSNVDYNTIEEMVLYPNPVKAGQPITLRNKNDIVTSIEIYNELGQKLNIAISYTDNEAIINTEELAAGNYLLKVNSNQITITKTIVIIE